MPCRSRPARFVFIQFRISHAQAFPGPGFRPGLAPWSAAGRQSLGAGRSSKRRWRGDHHGQQPHLAAHADSGDDGKHHRPGDRSAGQRHRQRRRPQVPAQPAGAQALCGRLQPRHPVESRLGYRQQRPVGGVCRRHFAVQLPGQWRQRPVFSTALGHGHDRRNRARRRDVRPLLRRLPRQFGGRGGGLHHQDARSV